MQIYYEENGITIYHGDCREVLPSLPVADLVLTDPPYGINISNKNLGVGRSTGIASTKMIYGAWDNERISADTLDLVRKAALNQIIWGGNYYADVLPASMGWLVWFKRDGLPKRSYADVELAWTSYNKASRLYTWRWDGFIRDGVVMRNGHPTEKPEQLFAWCINFASDITTILDPFMGSGTTLLAAKQLNRKAIGIETEEKYCEIAAERLRQSVLNFEPASPNASTQMPLENAPTLT